MFWDIWDRSFAPPAYAWTCPYSGYRQSSPGENRFPCLVRRGPRPKMARVPGFSTKRRSTRQFWSAKMYFSSKLLPGGLLPSRIYQIVLDDLQSRSWIIWGSGFGVIAQNILGSPPPGMDKILGNHTSWIYWVDVAHAMLSGNYGNDASSRDAKGSQQQFIWIDEKPKKKHLLENLNPSHHPTYCFFLKNPQFVQTCQKLSKKLIKNSKTLPAQKVQLVTWHIISSRIFPVFLLISDPEPPPAHFGPNKDMDQPNGTGFVRIFPLTARRKTSSGTWRSFCSKAFGNASTRAVAKSRSNS